eukprot:gene2420-8739_t
MEVMDWDNISPLIYSGVDSYQVLPVVQFLCDSSGADNIVHIDALCCPPEPPAPPPSPPSPPLRPPPSPQPPLKVPNPAQRSPPPPPRPPSPSSPPPTIAKSPPPAMSASPPPQRNANLNLYQLYVSASRSTNVQIDTVTKFSCPVFEAAIKDRLGLAMVNMNDAYPTASSEQVQVDAVTNFSCPVFEAAIKDRLGLAMVDVNDAYPATSSEQGGCTRVGKSTQRIFYKVFLFLTEDDWAWLKSSRGVNNKQFVIDAELLCDSTLNFATGEFGAVELELDWTSLPALSTSLDKPVCLPDLNLPAGSVSVSALRSLNVQVDTVTNFSCPVFEAAIKDRLGLAMVDVNVAYPAASSEQ